ncbi:Nn.00g072370.m01.CDS01 [Neocucurbitaria sp. VM-36]
MSHQLRKPEATDVQKRLLVEDEFNIEKLWGNNIKGSVWHPCIRNVESQTIIIVNKDGVLDYCGEHFAVKSPKGCAKHPYSGGFNKFYQEARKSGVTGILQPALPTEEQYRMMKSSCLERIPEIEEKEHRTKAPARERTKQTQGKKQQPAQLLKEIQNEKKREKETEHKKDICTELHFANGDGLVHVVTDVKVEKDTEVETQKVLEYGHEDIEMEEKKARGGNVCSRAAMYMEERKAEKAAKKAAKNQEKAARSEGV